MEDQHNSDKPLGVNPAYAGFQISKALITSEGHPDPSIRERARQKITHWLQVLMGMQNRTLEFGSRTPVKEVPAWVTLHVVTGGVTTGNLMAGGPLLPHERSWITTLSRQPNNETRGALNAYSLTDAGFAQLREMLRSRLYDVAVPEEGALLVVAWLLDHGHADAARQIVQTIASFFPSLRFYPAPATRPQQFGSKVFLQDVAETIERLRAVKPNRDLLAQQEAVRVWSPLYDRVVALFLETVEGAVPAIRRDANGDRLPPTNGKFPIDGGWPCQRYPEGWANRAQAALDDYQKSRRDHTRTKKPERDDENFAQLRKYLAQCINDPRRLSGRDVGKIRLILASYVTKRGTPGSDQCSAIRQRQARDISAPNFTDVAAAILPRLQSREPHAGIDDVTPIMQPISAAEAQHAHIPAGAALPPTIQWKIERCLAGTIDELIKRSLITSGDTIARLLPRVTSALRSQAFADTDLGHLYASIYSAFRKRRSLLLLNLASQVKLEELPWVAALEPFRARGVSEREVSQQALTDIVGTTLLAFPHAILPNKLLQELRALVKGAELDLPLVDEVAADIFMGRFSNKFVIAAQRAADLLDATLYQRYYSIDYAQVRAIPIDPETKAAPTRELDRFAQLCAARAGVEPGTWSVVTNGMILEQQQILTTQNLATLFATLRLTESLQPHLIAMARHCFEWICRRQQMKTPQRHARLITLKNTAYAWRQMIFYLSLLPAGQVQEFVAWSQQHLGEQPENFSSRFGPILRGLVLCAGGGSLEDDFAKRNGALRFLGWTKGEHPLLT